MSGPGQDLAAELADIAAMLPSGHLEAWARVLRLQPDAGGVSASRSIEALLIEAKPGFAIAGLADRLVSASHATDPSLPGAAIALGLEAAALAHADSAARSSDIVVSGPTGDTAAVRLTSSVISELIHDCRESLLVVSFAAFGVTEVVQELMLAARRGVHIDLVLESSAEQGGALRGSSAYWVSLRDREQVAGPACERKVPLLIPKRNLLTVKSLTALCEDVDPTDRSA